MALSLGDGADRVTRAEIRVMTTEREQIGGVNLSQGICDLGVLPAVLEATAEAIARGYNRDTRVRQL